MYSWAASSKIRKELYDYLYRHASYYWATIDKTPEGWPEAYFGVKCYQPRSILDHPHGFDRLRSTGICTQRTAYVAVHRRAGLVALHTEVSLGAIESMWMIKDVKF